MATTEQVTELITLMKQQIELQATQATQNAATAASASNLKVKRADRPIISSDMNDRDWSLFLDTWDRYKDMIGATGAGNATVNTVRNELRSACSADINRMLFEFVGPDVLAACDERTLLGHIKSVAVKQVHHEVHQLNFHRMTQEDGERVTMWAARLKSQAFLCKFETTCPCTPGVAVSYANKMVAQRLVAGLRNPEHTRRILAEASTLTTLDSKIERLQLLETTEESANTLHRSQSSSVIPPSAAAVQKSQYKKDQRRPPESKDDADAGSVVLCPGCGRSSHPNGKSLERSNCPALKVKCRRCHKKGHLAAVCKSSRSAPAVQDEPGEFQDYQLDDIPANASVSFALAQRDFRCGRRSRDET